MAGPGVAILVGRGDVPRRVAERLAAEGIPYFVGGFEGSAPDWLGEHPSLVEPIEKLGHFVSAFRNAGCTRLCLVGGMDRPQLNPLIFDATFLRFAPQVLPRLREGDDAALRAIAAFFEGEGFEMVGAHTLLGELVMPQGLLTTAEPSAQDLSDIARAEQILATLAPLDLGQGCVISGGLCLGIETLQGTDFMLDAVARTDRSEGDGGVLVKLPKVGQDIRMDLPTIGPDTVRGALSAGLTGIAMRAGAALIVDRETTVRRADEAGLFLVGRAE